MFKMYRVLCLAILVTVAGGQIVKEGVCNYASVNFVADLNITRMFGTWNQIARIENPSELGECSSVTIDGEYNNGTLTGVRVSSFEVFNKTKTTLQGTLGDASDAISGLYLMNITGFHVGEFVVQSTNYSDYAILYSCYPLTFANATANVNDTRGVLAWMYHRKASPSESEVAPLLELADSNPDLNGTTWRYVSHNKTACGNGAVSLVVPHILIIMATLFIGKEFV